MTQQVITSPTEKTLNSTNNHRAKNLIHFYRAVSLFSMPIRSSELGLRRRK